MCNTLKTHNTMETSTDDATHTTSSPSVPKYRHPKHKYAEHNCTSSHGEYKHIENSKNPSLCIPRMHAHFQKWQIHQVFEKLHIGKIMRIDQSYNHNTNTKRVFIHFEFWYKNERASNIQEILNSGKYVHIMHDDFHFWKCYQSKNPRK